MSSGEKPTRRWWWRSTEMPAACAAPRGCGLWKRAEEDSAQPYRNRKGLRWRRISEPRENCLWVGQRVRQLALSASGFAHLRHPGVRTAFHFGGGNVFHMLRQTPLVSKRITNLAVSIAPELVLQRHLDF